jgi:hypothetical protein
MKANVFTYFIIILMIWTSCNEKETASEIIQKTINTIDTIETIYYKQDMARTNPQNVNDTIFRYREMYLKRLISDSIVGVKGHWYMYVNDKKKVFYEDIYDGNRLIRKNNEDSIVRIYDLDKYPDFKRNHFWSHNTLFAMQFEFEFMQKNSDSYSYERLNDTIINNKTCYQILAVLMNKMTMPGFAAKLEENQGSISKTIYFIDKQTNYPVGMKGEFYSADNPEQKTFIDQNYYDIKFNLKINEDERFNTTIESIEGYEIIEMKPDNHSQIESEAKAEAKKLAKVNELKDDDLNDSLFEINPAGFVIGHSENPSWDVAYILFENGNLIYTTYPPREKDYYKLGTWELKNDSLKFKMTKFVSSQGTGKKIKVHPSVNHQSGQSYQSYETKVVDTLIIESFDWNELKALIKSKDYWQWRIEDTKAADYLFDEFDK